MNTSMQKKRMARKEEVEYRGVERKRKERDLE